MKFKVILFFAVHLGFSPLLFALEAKSAFKSAAEKNMKIMEALKAAKLNCCDYRQEARCNDILKPNSETGGLQMLDVKFQDDGQVAAIAPFSYDETENGFKFSGIGGGRSEFLVKIARTISPEKDKANWIAADGRKIGIDVSKVSLDKATRMRPFGSGGGPSACYFQSQMPGLQEFINKEQNNDIWCYHAEDPKIIEASLGTVKTCQMDVVCRDGSLFGESVNTPAVCKKIQSKSGEWVCPPPTYCAADPSVTMTKGVASLTGEEKFPDFKKTSQGNQ